MPGKAWVRTRATAQPPKPPPVMRQPMEAALEADGLGDPDHGVQFGAAHLVIVAQGKMAGIHQPADCGPVGGSHGLGGMKGAFDLADDMTGATPDRRVELAAASWSWPAVASRSEGAPRKRAASSHWARRLAYPPPVSSCAIGVGDEQGDRRVGHRGQPGHAGAAVQEQEDAACP